MGARELFISGRTAPGFEKVGEIFEDFLRRGWDIGSSFAAFHFTGKPLVNLCGGVRDKDAANPHPYDSDTIQIVFSSTKFAESMCIALLVDRGLIKYDDTIAEYWPEFATDARKAKVTIRQLMMHRAGLPFLDAKLTDAELFDSENMSRCLARQKQFPGLFELEPSNGDWRRQSPAPPEVYHAVTRGLFASALLRRVDQRRRTLGRFFHDELATPLNLSFWIGLPESEEGRVATTYSESLKRLLKPGPDGDLSETADDPRYQLTEYERKFLTEAYFEPGSVPARALAVMAPEGVPPQALGNSRKIRACELPSSNGVGSAESLAKLATLAVGNGTLGEKKIFSKSDTIRQSIECADTYSVDAFLMTPIAYTQGGFARLHAHDKNETLNFGWGGAGGSLVRFVPELGIGCSYVPSALGVRLNINDPRGNALLKATIECARSGIH